MGALYCNYGDTGRIQDFCSSRQYCLLGLAFWPWKQVRDEDGVALISFLQCVSDFIDRLSAPNYQSNL